MIRECVRQRTAVPIKSGIVSQKKNGIVSQKKKEGEHKNWTTNNDDVYSSPMHPGLLLSSPQGMIDKALSEGQTDTQVSVSDEILEYI